MPNCLRRPGWDCPKMAQRVMGRDIPQNRGTFEAANQTQQSVALNNVKFHNEVVADGRRGSQGQDLAERGRMPAISLSGEQQEGGDRWATWRTSRTLSREKAESREGWSRGRLLWRPQWDKRTGLQLAAIKDHALRSTWTLWPQQRGKMREQFFKGKVLWIFWELKWEWSYRREKFSSTILTAQLGSCISSFTAGHEYFLYPAPSLIGFWMGKSPFYSQYPARSQVGNALPLSLTSEVECIFEETFLSSTMGSADGAQIIQVSQIPGICMC